MNSIGAHGIVKHDMGGNHSRVDNFLSFGEIFVVSKVEFDVKTLLAGWTTFGLLQACFGVVTTDVETTATVQICVIVVFNFIFANSTIRHVSNAKICECVNVFVE